jgi:hypothetical protein
MWQYPISSTKQKENREDVTCAKQSNVEMNSITIFFESCNNKLIINT